MIPETRQCQNCKQNFTIEPEDFKFYEKISVPPPSWCPECRFMRRIIFRNEINLYRRPCDFCKKQIISVYDANTKFPVYCNSCWFSDQWDPIRYGTSFDLSKPFFEQIKQLLDVVPRLALAQLKNINSEYSNFSAENKNCYLVISALASENCAYCARLFYSRDCFDCLDISHCEQCYECVRLDQSSRAIHCDFSESLLDCYYCFDCRGLSNCFGCVGLRNKNYAWLNRPLAKEDYQTNLAKFRSDPIFQKQSIEEYDRLLVSLPRRYANILKSVNSTGDNLIESKNCRSCFFVKKAENAKYVFTASEIKDLMDASYDDNSELDYEIMSGERDYKVILSTSCWYSSDLTYCNFCTDSSDLFGCVGIRKKNYCILNKQYSKEEYESLKASIIRQMNQLPYKDKVGRVYSFGEFFPAEFSAFAYNETVALNYFPLTKTAASSAGFSWKESKEKTYAISMPVEKIPAVENANNSILNEILQCAHNGECNEACTTAFKITPDELQFHKNLNISLPIVCPNCRYARRLKQRNPLKLWYGTCQCAGVKNNKGTYTNTTSHFHAGAKCPNEFETAYTPDRPEIVYCEQCYNAEVV